MDTNWIEIGCNFDLMLKGVREIVNYAKEINSLANYQQIKTIDIGGGLPVNFACEEVIPTFQVYSSLLRESGLFVCLFNENTFNANINLILNKSARIVQRRIQNNNGVWKIINC